MSNEFERFIQNNREDFDDQIPDPAVLERIHNQMAVKPKKQGVFVPVSVIRWAAACLLLVGAGTVLILQKAPVHNIAKTEVNKQSVPAAQAPLVETAEKTIQAVEQPRVISRPQKQYVTYEKPAGNSMSRQVMFAKLNNSESPGQRILGAEQAYKLGNTDKEIVDVLVKTMNSDPNTNVRMAALDALSQFRQVTYVKHQLIAALKVQKDPMVQIGLIQLLTGMKETIILNDLEKIANDESALKEVRDQAYSSIFTLET